MIVGCIESIAMLLVYLTLVTLNLWQIEAMVQDEAARGWLSGSEALNIQLENQVNRCPWLHCIYMFLHLVTKGTIHIHFLIISW